MTKPADNEKYSLLSISQISFAVGTGHDGILHCVGLVVLVLMVAVASVGCERQDRPAPRGERQTARVSMFNATHDALPMETRSIQSDFSVDCELVGEQPDRYLSPDHLTASQRLGAGIDEEPLSGMELPLSSGREVTEFTDRCQFAFLELATPDRRLSPIAVVWPRSLSEKNFYPDVDAPRELLPEEQTVVATTDYSEADPDQVRPWRHRPCEGSLRSCSDDERAEALEPPEGAQYEWMVIGEEPEYTDWEPSPLSYRPVGNPDDEECDTGADSTPLKWDDPPQGRWRVEGVDEVTVEFGSESNDETTAEDSDDLVEWDCWEVVLADEENQTTWSVCGSERLARRIESDHVTGGVFVEFFSEDQFGSPPAAYQALTVEIERTDEEENPFERERIEVVRGHGVPDHIGLNWRTQPVTDCEPFRELADCKQMSLPVHLEIDASGEVIEIRPGETMGLDPQANRRLEYVRGMHRVVSDLRCSDERTGHDELEFPGAYVEFVYYPGASEVEM